MQAAMGYQQQFTLQLPSIQGLLTAEACLAKKGLTTPRLELGASHMTANAVDNVRRALKGKP